MSRHKIRSKATTAKKRKTEPAFIRKPFQMRWLVLILLGGALIAWFSGWWRFDFSKPSSSGVGISITMPTTVAAGEYTTMTVRLQNQESIPLTDVDITLQWPDGFVYSTSTPVARGSQYNQWRIDRMEPDEEIEIEIGLQLFGETGTQKVITASAVYELENFSSEFFIDTSYTVLIGENTITVTPDDHDPLPPLTESVWRVVIENNDDEVLPVSWLRIILPPGFVPASFAPDADVIDHEDGRAVLFELSGMEPGEQRVIKLTGEFSTDSSSPQEFIWHYGMDTETEARIVQQGSFEQFVIGDEADIAILINDSDAPAPIALGDTVTFTLRARNITNDDLTDLEWSLGIPVGVFDQNAWQSNVLLDTSDASVVRITSENNESLKTVSAGDEVEITLTGTVQTQSSARALQGQARLRLMSPTETEHLSFSKSYGPIALEKVAVWHSGAYYFSEEGVQVGSGPLPPRVGEKTNYRVQWNISEIANSAQAVSIEARLPDAVAWNNQFSRNQGVVQYNATTRTVKWTIANANQYDFNLGELEAIFEIGLIPTEDMVGATTQLTNDIQLVLTTVGGETITYTSSGLTTALEADLYSGGKGVVVGGN